MPKVFLSIGSNIDREKNLDSAIRRLGARYAPLTLSSVYESETVGFQGDNFYNLVAAFDTDESLDSIAAFITQIEVAHGRQRNEKRYSSRTLDIDILLYGNLVRHDRFYDIPRSDIKQHAFVLLPLVEITPDSIHPETGKSYKQMWREFDQAKQRLRKVEFAMPPEVIRA
jgi:2-amino-4-hydroxy-6-hydroxymethyldihydropteridine diphosphokinase